MSGYGDLDGWAGVTVRPISTWPGDPIREHDLSPFESSWSATVALLTRELRMIGATRVVLELALREDQIRLDGKPRASARATHPGVVLSFDSRHGPLRYATAKFTDWRDNLRAIALGLESLRRVDRYGIATRGEQYAGWKQIGSGSDDGPSIARGAALIRDAGSVLAALRATHPDKGGSEIDFVSVTMAREAGYS